MQFLSLMVIACLILLENASFLERWYHFSFLQAMIQFLYIHISVLIIALSFFLIFPISFFHPILSVWRYSFNLSLSLLGTNSFSLPLFQNVFVSPFTWRIVSFHVEFTIESSFRGWKIHPYTNANKRRNWCGKQLSDSVLSSFIGKYHWSKYWLFISLCPT